jgi:hypothetical protein
LVTFIIRAVLLKFHLANEAEHFRAEVTRIHSLVAHFNIFNTFARSTQFLFIPPKGMFVKWRCILFAPNNSIVESKIAFIGVTIRVFNVKIIK